MQVYCVGLAGDEAGTASTSGGIWITSAAHSIAGKACSHRSGTCRSIVWALPAMRPVQAAHQVASGLRSQARPAHRSSTCKSIVGAGLAGDEAGAGSTSGGVWITSAAHSIAGKACSHRLATCKSIVWALPAMRPVQPAHQVASGLRSQARPAHRSGTCKSIVGAGLAGDEAGTASTSGGVWITIAGKACPQVRYMQIYCGSRPCRR
ncbi:hypothetical protein ABIE20_004824 [Pseudomonas sp. 2835]